MKQNQTKEQLRKFAMGFQLISSLALGIFIIAVLYFALQYFDISLYSREDILKAQKIGNWEFPDKNYVLKNFENISLENKNIGVAEIKDKKSGNRLIIFDVGYTQSEFLKIKDIIQMKFLGKYNLGNYFLRSDVNKIGRIGEEFVYNIVGWSGDNGGRMGIIGRLDCLKNKKTGSNIAAVASNSVEKYDQERALEFISTLDCPIRNDNGNVDVEIGDNLDTDGDGLTDKIELMLLSDRYKKDTDGDGFNDLEELQGGFSPMIPRPYDKYASEDFEKVKEDIKFFNIEIYDKLFPKPIPTPVITPTPSPTPKPKR